jgi:exopolyphosphatase/guanosine-5'-triphosphate,3'-diphosphate pyrophosphatase
LGSTGKLFDVDASHGRLASGSERKHAGARSATTGREGLPHEPLYGAVDLGTNNCRLLIATPAEGGFVVTDAFSRIVRLGEGLSRSGRLDDAAMARTIEALRVCANKLTWRKVARRRLVATEACRRAQNGAEFIARVTEETGLVLEVIDRETEAQLAATGAAPLVDAAAESCLVFDIGGGSTELMWLAKNDGRWDIAAWTSLAAGVVTISERFGGADVTREAFAEMRQSLQQPLLDFAAEVKARTGIDRLPDHLLGTSGTVTTIAGVQLGLRRYDRSRVDGCWLVSDRVGEVTEKLLGLSFAERAAHPCIGKDRADLVLAGCAILEEIRAIFPSPRIRVADRGLREGILTLMMQDDGVYGSAG